MRPTRGESVTRSLCHHCHVPNRQAAERANQIRRAGETRPAGMQGPRCGAQLAMAAEIASATGDGSCRGHSSLRDELVAGGDNYSNQQAQLLLYISRAAVAQCHADAAQRAPTGAAGPPLAAGPIGALVRLRCNRGSPRRARFGSPVAAVVAKRFRRSEVWQIHATKETIARTRTPPALILRPACACPLRALLCSCLRLAVSAPSLLLLQSPLPCPRLTRSTQNTQHTTTHTAPARPVPPSLVAAATLPSTPPIPPCAHADPPSFSDRFQFHDPAVLNTPAAAISLLRHGKPPLSAWWPRVPLPVLRPSHLQRQSRQCRQRQHEQPLSRRPPQPARG